MDKKFEYLGNCEAELADKTAVVLATDADGPGRALAEELARRLGRERCRAVEWPRGGPDRRAVALAEAALVAAEAAAEAMRSRGSDDPDDVKDAEAHVAALREALREAKTTDAGPRKAREIPSIRPSVHPSLPHPPLQISIHLHSSIHLSPPHPPSSPTMPGC